MSKSRKHRSSRKGNKKNLLKNIKKTTQKVLPVVDSSLKTIGKTVKNAAEKSAPVVEKGISGVYGALATGFDLGVKGVGKMMSLKSGKKHRKTHKRRH